MPPRPTRATLLVILVAMGAAAFAQDQGIELSAREAWVRKGFSIEWTFFPPSPDDGSWLKLPGDYMRRPIVIRDLGLDPAAKGGFFRLLPNRAEKYTIVQTFEADSALLASSTGLGLFLGRIGQGWEIYLNGSMIQSEYFIGRSGRVARERSVRGALVSLDRRYLKAGTNVLAILVAGDPVDARTGLFAGGPYRIGDYAVLEGLRREFLELMLIGIYFFFAVYHLYLFARRPGDPSYLFFGAGTLLLSAYLFTRSWIVFDIVEDSALIRAVELFSLFLIAPFFLAFFDVLLRGRVSRPSFAYGLFAAFLALSAPFFWAEPFMLLWQLTAVLPFGYLLVMDLVVPLARRAGRLRGFPAGPSVASPADEGILAGVVLAAVALLATDLVRSRAGLDLSLSKYGFLVLVFGSAFLLAYRFVRVHREAEALAGSLEQRVGARTAELSRAVEEQGAMTASLAEANERLKGSLARGARDMRIATQVQQGFFPRKPPLCPGWDFGFVTLPRAGVSGDFYEFYVEEGEGGGAGTEGEFLGLVLGEVSGTGIAPGLVTVLARSVFYREFLEGAARPLGSVIESANAELSRELESVDNYLTALVLRAKGAEVEYANAGHPDLLYRKGGFARAKLLSPPKPEYKGGIMGRAGIPVSCASLKFNLGRGDCLLAHSPALAASTDPEGQAFGVEGVVDAFGRAPQGSPAEIIQFMLEEWRFHLRGKEPSGDLTIVVARRL